jgi:hypothetical protein
MQISQVVSASIQGRAHWNDTAIDLYKDQSYLLKASGEWRDWQYRSSPCGYKSRNTAQRLTTWARRHHSADWFALVGSVSKRHDTYFTIGCGGEYRPTRDGRLFCFANDLWFFYFNNSGCVQLTVTRTA